MSGLDHVSFTVSDLDRAIAFYSELFRAPPLKVGREADGNAGVVIGYDPLDLRYAWFAIPGTTTLLELFEYVEPRGAAGRLETRNPGNGHLGLVVDDVQAEWTRMAGAGATFASPEPVAISGGSWDGACVIYMRDPDGITIELMQSPPDGASRFA